MGRSLVRTALNYNDLVCAVGQSRIDSLSTLQKSHSGKSNSFLAQLCDVRIRSTVDAVIQRTIKHFGHIDIIANCSGYGVIGACEDQDEYEIRNQFEVNFMGTLNIIQLSLPHFRSREEGRYLIFSSTSGSLGVPGLGPYCASKYAVEGLIESMLYEVDGFGIRATLVEPSHLRRDDVVNREALANSTDTHAPAPQKHPKASTTATSNAERLPLYGHFLILPPSPPYSTPDSPSKHAQRLLQWIGDHQPTSVVKAAELSWQLGHCSFPPLRLLLGTYAVESVRDRLKCVIEEIEDWKYLSFGALEDQLDGGEGGEGEDGDGKEDGEEEEDEDGGEGNVKGNAKDVEGDEDDMDEEEGGDGGEEKVEGTGLKDKEAPLEKVRSKEEKGKAPVKQEASATKDVQMDDA
jgi:NAD(P)-dependent dehydrogenase (short-subunit alcohol dehydrogenase family)